jgi:predicted nucleic acid-binding protein
MSSAYIETSVIVGWAKRDLPVAERRALGELALRWHTGEIELCTSEVAREELQKHALGRSAAEERIYSLFKQLPLATESHFMPALLGSRSRQIAQLFGGKLEFTDEVFQRLLDIVPHRNDARHLFQAAHSGLDYFVTCDERSILLHAAAIEAAVAIKARSPTQLLVEIEAIAVS